jgi:hypothetical protein
MFACVQSGHLGAANPYVKKDKAQTRTWFAKIDHCFCPAKGTEAAARGWCPGWNTGRIGRCAAVDRERLMMDVQQEAQQDAPATKRGARWLPLLERELKQRTGWVDEVVSPFARRLHDAQPRTRARPAVCRAA